MTVTNRRNWTNGIVWIWLLNISTDFRNTLEQQQRNKKWIKRSCVKPETWRSNRSKCLTQTTYCYWPFNLPTFPLLSWRFSKFIQIAFLYTLKMSGRIYIIADLFQQLLASEKKKGLKFKLILNGSIAVDHLSSSTNNRKRNPYTVFLFF